MIRNAIVILTSLVLLGHSCGVGEPDPHVTPVPGEELCAQACTRMGELSCEEAQPVPSQDGGTITCAEFCTYQHSQGVYWNTTCLTSIASCVEIETVCNVPPPR